MYNLSNYCMASYAFLFLTNSASAATALDPSEILIDRISAIVDTRPILYSDIKRKVDVGPLVIVSDHPAPKDSSNEVKALNDSVNLELVLGASRDLDIEVSDADLDQEINRFLEEQKMTKDKLVELLKNEGETFERYKIDFKNNMTLRRFQRKVIAPAIKITDKDIETYYLSQSNSGAADLVEVTLRQLVIKIDSSTNIELQQTKKNLADDVYQKLRSGLDFSEAIGLYSDVKANNENQGKLTLKIKDLALNIRDAVDPLKNGEFTKPIASGNNLIIFQVVDKKLTVNKEFETKRAQLEQELKLLELRNQTNKWLDDQRQKVTIRFIND
jgi:peptidyl-prolyl cis-trans isomerase SurA